MDQGAGAVSVLGCRGREENHLGPELIDQSIGAVSEIQYPLGERLKIQYRGGPKTRGDAGNKVGRRASSFKERNHRT